MQDLADEARQIRLRIAAEYPEFRVDSGPWLFDELAVLETHVSNIARDAQAEALAAHFINDSRSLSPVWLWYDMLTSNGSGLETLDFTGIDLEYDDARLAAESIRDAAHGTNVGPRLDAVLNLPVRIATPADEPYHFYSSASEILFVLNTIAHTATDEADQQTAAECSYRFLRPSIAIESRATLIAYFRGHAFRDMHRRWLIRHIRGGTMDEFDVVVQTDLLKHFAPRSNQFVAQLVEADLLAMLTMPDAVPVVTSSTYAAWADRLADLVESTNVSSAEDRLRAENAAQPLSALLAQAISGGYLDSFSYEYGYHTLITTEAKARTEREALTTMLAIATYQAKHGYSPQRLDELVPEYLERLPIDGFDGKPLRYTSRPHNRYELYSVGWDGVDNRGSWHPRQNSIATTRPLDQSVEIPGWLLELAEMPLDMPPLRMLHDPIGYDYRLDPWAPD
ncbi:MAG: hypothetical protein AAFR96_06580 [Planctomycetota bacterium]